MEEKVRQALDHFTKELLQWGELAPDVWAPETCEAIAKLICEAVDEKLQKERIENG